MGWPLGGRAGGRAGGSEGRTLTRRRRERAAWEGQGEEARAVKRARSAGGKRWWQEGEGEEGKGEEGEQEASSFPPWKWRSRRRRPGQGLMRGRKGAAEGGREEWRAIWQVWSGTGSGARRVSRRCQCPARAGGGREGGRCQASERGPSGAPTTEACPPALDEEVAPDRAAIRTRPSGWGGPRPKRTKGEVGGAERVGAAGGGSCFESRRRMQEGLGRPARMQEGLGRPARTLLRSWLEARVAYAEVSG